MKIYPIRKTTNYFIHISGYVIKVENGKEEIIKPKKSKNTHQLHVMINNKSYILLYLMIEYFKPEMKATDSFRYKVTKDLRIPAESIMYRSLQNSALSEEQDLLIQQWNCSAKASSANMRCEKQITPLQVLTTLQIHNYKCIYCQCQLHEKTWHLDHYHPLSKEGKNVLENIVPACKTCNTMKGALVGKQFYNKCIDIVNNYIFKDSEF